MNKNNSLQFNYILIVIIIILIVFILFVVIRKNTYESFDTSLNTMSMNFQMGVSGITPTGTINFINPFKKPPTIFTQIISNPDGVENAYSVQILNVKNTSFDYSKSKVINMKQGQYDITQLKKSEVESFSWIAFGL
jgi:hypothetical protein